MKFGVMPAYGAAAVEQGEYATALGRLAEELGFESVWPVEHVVMPATYDSRYPYDRSGRMPIEEAAVPDPLTWLTWVAAGTRELLLGTAVLILPQRNPVVLAKTVASLDRLSGGRLRLGIGVGWLREEAEAVGTSFHDRGRRTDEYIAAMRTLWTQPIASFRGEYVCFRDVRCNPRPNGAGGVPIHIGGHSPAAARRAGRLGDGFLPMGETLEDVWRLRTIMEEAAREAGRDPSQIEISCIGPADEDQARALADSGALRMLVASHEPDIESARRALGRFSERVIGRLA